MRVTPRSRLILRLQNALAALLILLALGLAAWLGTQYRWEADWTQAKRNTLAPATRSLLKTLDKPLAFTDYAGPGSELQGSVRAFVERYQRAKPDTTLKFVDPDSDPQAVRDQGITAVGELVVTYAGRSEKLTQIDEYQVSNAIQRLARSTEHYVAFLSGDGERDPLGQHNFDLGEFGKQLTDKGFKLVNLNLAATPTVPDNTSLLVVAGPQADLLPGMVTLVRDYVKRGGDLLWLSDPGPLHGLAPLAQDLGISFGKGTILDMDSQLFGISNPAVVLVPKYETGSPITTGFTVATLYPTVTDVTAAKDSGWTARPFLETAGRSWLETGPLSGEVQYDAKRGDKLGPLVIGLSLTRSIKDKDGSREQRVVVTGDGDFLSNQYLGNLGNLALGFNIVNWLVHDDRYLNIDALPARDVTLSLSSVAQAAIGIGFLFLLPALLLAAGILIRVRRRRR